MSAATRGEPGIGEERVVDERGMIGQMAAHAGIVVFEHSQSPGQETVANETNVVKVGLDENHNHKRIVALTLPQRNRSNDWWRTQLRLVDMSDAIWEQCRE